MRLVSVLRLRARTLRSRTFRLQGGNRRGRTTWVVTLATILVAILVATLPARWLRAVLAAWGMLYRGFFTACSRRGRLAGPRDGLADKLFDCGDGLAVGRRDDGQCRAASPGAPGTADAVDIVVRVMRYVEIKHVAHVGNVETACGYIRGDQQGHLILAKLIKCRSASRLVHVTMERHRGKAVTLQRTMQRSHFAFAITEDNCVF